MRTFAAKAGLKSVAFIADVERGYRNPSPDVLAKMAKALEVPAALLRSMDDRPPVTEIQTMTRRNPEWAAAFREVVDLAGKGVTPRQILKALREADPTLPKEGQFNF